MLEKEKDFIARFKARASHAAQVQSRVKKLEKIDLIEPPKEERTVKFEFQKPPRSGDEVVKLQGVTKVLAMAVTFFVVDRATYPSTDAGETAFKNERQRVGAVLRSHAAEAGLGKIGIDWHPVGNYPQVSLKG
jgi:hypothetical protein